MSRRSRMLVLSASVAGMLAAGTIAVARADSKVPQPGASAEARLTWAKRHVELVCRPLEAQRMFDRATRCYNDVARLIGASAREAPTATAEKAEPASQPARQSAPVPAPVTPAASPAVIPVVPAAAPAAAPVVPPKSRPATRPASVRTAAANPAPVRAAPATRLQRPARTIAVAQNSAPRIAAVAPTSTTRCSGVSCLRYTLLGVGF